jgi:hypothetical protein
MTSMMSCDLLLDQIQQTQMGVTHDAQQNRSRDSRTEPPDTRIRSQTRIAYRTLSIPHARATSCWVSTCRQASR